MINRMEKTQNTTVRKSNRKFIEIGEIDSTNTHDAHFPG